MDTRTDHTPSAATAASTSSTSSSNTNNTTAATTDTRAKIYLEFNIRQELDKLPEKIFYEVERGPFGIRSLTPSAINALKEVSDKFERLKHPPDLWKLLNVELASLEQITLTGDFSTAKARLDNIACLNKVEFWQKIAQDHPSCTAKLKVIRETYQQWSRADQYAYLTSAELIQLSQVLDTVAEIIKHAQNEIANYLRENLSETIPTAIKTLLNPKPNAFKVFSELYQAYLNRFMQRIQHAQRGIASSMWQRLQFVSSQQQLVCEDIVNVTLQSLVDIGWLKDPAIAQQVCFNTNVFNHFHWYIHQHAPTQYELATLYWFNPPIARTMQHPDERRARYFAALHRHWTRLADPRGELAIELYQVQNQRYVGVRHYPLDANNVLEKFPKTALYNGPEIHAIAEYNLHRRCIFLCIDNSDNPSFQVLDGMTVQQMEQALSFCFSFLTNQKVQLDGHSSSQPSAQLVLAWQQAFATQLKMMHEYSKHLLETTNTFLQHALLKETIDFNAKNLLVTPGIIKLICNYSQNAQANLELLKSLREHICNLFLKFSKKHAAVKTQQQAQNVIRTLRNLLEFLPDTGNEKQIEAAKQLLIELFEAKQKYVRESSISKEQFQQACQSIFGDATFQVVNAVYQLIGKAEWHKRLDDVDFAKQVQHVNKEKCDTALLNINEFFSKKIFTKVALTDVLQHVRVVVKFYAKEQLVTMFEPVIEKFLAQYDGENGACSLVFLTLNHYPWHQKYLFQRLTFLFNNKQDVLIAELGTHVNPNMHEDYSRNLSAFLSKKIQEHTTLDAMLLVQIVDCYLTDTEKSAVSQFVITQFIKKLELAISMQQSPLHALQQDVEIFKSLFPSLVQSVDMQEGLEKLFEAAMRRPWNIYAAYLIEEFVFRYSSCDYLHSLQASYRFKWFEACLNDQLINDVEMLFYKEQKYLVSTAQGLLNFYGYGLNFHRVRNILLYELEKGNKCTELLKIHFSGAQEASIDSKVDSWYSDMLELYRQLIAFEDDLKSIEQHFRHAEFNLLVQKCNLINMKARLPGMYKTHFPRLYATLLKSVQELLANEELQETEVLNRIEKCKECFFGIEKTSSVHATLGLLSLERHPMVYRLNECLHDAELIYKINMQFAGTINQLQGQWTQAFATDRDLCKKQLYFIFEVCPKKNRDEIFTVLGSISHMPMLLDAKLALYELFKINNNRQLLQNNSFLEEVLNFLGKAQSEIMSKPIHNVAASTNVILEHKTSGLSAQTVVKRVKTASAKNYFTGNGDDGANCVNLDVPYDQRILNYLIHSQSESPNFFLPYIMSEWEVEFEKLLQIQKTLNKDICFLCPEPGSGEPARFIIGAIYQKNLLVVSSAGIDLRKEFWQKLQQCSRELEVYISETKMEWFSRGKPTNAVSSGPISIEVMYNFMRITPDIINSWLKNITRQVLGDPAREYKIIHVNDQWLEPLRSLTKPELKQRPDYDRIISTIRKRHCTLLDPENSTQQPGDIDYWQDCEQANIQQLMIEFCRNRKSLDDVKKTSYYKSLLQKTSVQPITAPTTTSSVPIEPATILQGQEIKRWRQTLSVLFPGAQMQQARSVSPRLGQRQWHPEVFSILSQLQDNPTISTVPCMDKVFHFDWGHAHAGALIAINIVYQKIFSLPMQQVEIILFPTLLEKKLPRVALVSEQLPQKHLVSYLAEEKVVTIANFMQHFLAALCIPAASNVPENYVVVQESTNKADVKLINNNNVSLHDTVKQGSALRPSIIFCFDQMMQPLDKETIDNILHKDIYRELYECLLELGIYQQSCMYQFSAALIERYMQDPSKPKMLQPLLPNNLVRSLCQRWFQLQQFLMDTNSRLNLDVIKLDKIRPIDILRQFDAQFAQQCEKLLSNPDLTLEQRYSGLIAMCKNVDTITCASKNLMTIDAALTELGDMQQIMALVQTAMKEVHVSSHLKNHPIYDKNSKFIIHYHTFISLFSKLFESKKSAGDTELRYYSEILDVLLSVLKRVMGPLTTLANYNLDAHPTWKEQLALLFSKFNINKIPDEQQTVDTLRECLKLAVDAIRNNSSEKKTYKLWLKDFLDNEIGEYLTSFERKGLVVKLELNSLKAQIEEAKKIFKDQESVLDQYFNELKQTHKVLSGKIAKTNSSSSLYRNKFETLAKHLQSHWLTFYGRVVSEDASWYVQQHQQQLKDLKQSTEQLYRTVYAQPSHAPSSLDVPLAEQHDSPIAELRQVVQQVEVQAVVHDVTKKQISRGMEFSTQQRDIYLRKDWLGKISDQFKDFWSGFKQGFSEFADVVGGGLTELKNTVLAIKEDIVQQFHERVQREGGTFLGLVSTAGYILKRTLVVLKDAITEIGKATWQIGKETLHAIIHPLETIKAIIHDIRSSTIWQLVSSWENIKKVAGYIGQQPAQSLGYGFGVGIPGVLIGVIGFGVFGPVAIAAAVPGLAISGAIVEKNTRQLIQANAVASQQPTANASASNTGSLVVASNSEVSINVAGLQQLSQEVADIENIANKAQPMSEELKSMFVQTQQERDALNEQSSDKQEKFEHLASATDEAMRTGEESKLSTYQLLLKSLGMNLSQQRSHAHDIPKLPVDVLADDSMLINIKDTRGKLHCFAKRVLIIDSWQSLLMSIVNSVVSQEELVNDLKLIMSKSFAECQQQKSVADFIERIQNLVTVSATKFRTYPQLNEHNYPALHKFINTKGELSRVDVDLNILSNFFDFVINQQIIVRELLFSYIENFCAQQQPKKQFVPVYADDIHVSTTEVMRNPEQCIVIMCLQEIIWLEEMEECYIYKLEPYTFQLSQEDQEKPNFHSLYTKSNSRTTSTNHSLTSARSGSSSSNSSPSSTADIFHKEVSTSSSSISQVYTSAPEYVQNAAGCRFQRLAVSGNGDCGYIAFGIDRTYAYQLLKNKMLDIRELLMPAIKEELLKGEFIHYLTQQQAASPTLLELIRKRNLEAQQGRKRVVDEIDEQIFQYAEDLNIIDAYINYDVRDKRIDGGWSHPCVLQALAHIQGIRLDIWIIGNNSALLPHPLYHQHAARGATQTTSLLFINNNHFERLDVVAQAVVNNKIRN